MDWNKSSERIIPTSRPAVINDNKGLNNARGLFDGIIWYFPDRELFNCQRIQLITLNHSWVIISFVNWWTFIVFPQRPERREYFAQEMINGHLFQSNICRNRTSSCWLIPQKPLLVNYLMFTSTHRFSFRHGSLSMGGCFKWVSLILHQCPTEP